VVLEEVETMRKRKDDTRVLCRLSAYRCRLREARFPST
jgi:hypothetical protein